MKKTIFAAAAALAALPVPAHADTIVLAGGCFWGMEGVFEHVKGVTNVTSGYAGGSAKDATYDAVSTERTGHAEAIRVTFDSSKISLGEVLNVYFVVAHDPTQKNGQYPDEGPSYRSAIFPQTAAQRSFAEAYINALNAKPTYRGKIATRIESGSFFAAEAYHQDFMRRNPTHPYIQRWDVTKVRKLKATFPTLYRTW
ncbi:MAG: peptide-methionine (S)-S-oxide reductase MsrA [Novosphingobium sp.]|uniref:peptide-methionine (S)-S-oxide reductase MsrA n=1 Tax=Novosphingobium sp. TaxID=1874826 RepID=UPI003C7AD55F